jgi:DNA gyrase inhibitor GyrI
VVARIIFSTIALGVAYDDPNVTAAEQCRYDACVVVPASFAPDRWMNVMDVLGGKYAVSEFVGTAHEIRGAWEAVPIVAAGERVRAG